MKTLEQLGYRKVEEEQDKIVYTDGCFSICIDKKTKHASKHWHVDYFGHIPSGYNINTDEQKAIDALFKELGMTTKEALEAMCKRCSKNVQVKPSKDDPYHNECPFRDIYSYCEEYNIIKKALEARQ